MSEQLYLIARIGGRTVAFQAEQVEAAVDLVAMTPAPLAVPGIEGLTALRSRVVTVIDPRVMLGLPTTDPLPVRSVVTRVDGHAYAILVEALDDVAAYPTTALPAGVALERGWNSAAIALIERDGEPVLVVDLAQLIPVPHGAALAA